MKPAEAQDEATVSAELLIGNLLRYGVATSLPLILLGMLVTFWRHPDYLSSPDALEPLIHPHSTPHQLHAVLAGAYAMRGQALVMSGLVANCVITRRPVA